MLVSELTRLVGDIDIYLFDQLLRGRITPGMRVLDAGCGAGRNIVYLLHAGFEVFAATPARSAIATVQALAAALRAAPASATTSASSRSRR